MSLTTKIFLGFAFLLATFGFLTFYSVQEYHEVGEDLRSLNDGHLALARLVGQLETHEQNRFRDLRRSVSEDDPRTRQVILRIAAAYFPDVVRARVRELREVSEQQLARFKKKGDSESQSKIDFYRGIIRSVDRIQDQNDGIEEVTERLLAAAQAKEPVPESLKDELSRREETTRAELYELNKRINDETDRTVERAERDERRALWRVLLMTAIALFVGILVTILASRALAPIRELVAFARAISRGDYEQTINPSGDDELSALAEELTAMSRARKERELELDRQRGELERAYHRVDELKRYHESVVRSLKTAILVTDKGLRITSTNRAAESHFGLAQSAAKGRALDTLPISEKLVERLGPLEQLVSSGETASAQAIPIGDLLLDVTIFPFENERKEVLGLVLACEDVTEAVRTKEALIRSERLAAIGRMSAHVTHEVRNPLSSIGLNAELLGDLVQEISQDRAQDPSVKEAQKICTAIGREVDRLTAITEAYLRFARLPQPDKRPEQLLDLVKTVVAFVRPDCKAAKVDVVLSLPEQAPLVAVDADQLRQALLNLVRNGKESMPRGGRLEIGVEVHDDHVAIYVRDGGVGIAKENLSRIFDPFFSTKLTGTGLGLALTQQIVTEHGGELRVRSEPGSGSEFTIVMNYDEPTRIPAVLESHIPEKKAAGS